VLIDHLGFFVEQVNLDFDSEQDMINKLRVGLSFQPVSHPNWDDSVSTIYGKLTWLPSPPT
jgi:hypothetical protein